MQRTGPQSLAAQLPQPVLTQLQLVVPAHVVPGGGIRRQGQPAVVDQLDLQTQKPCRRPEPGQCVRRLLHSAQGPPPLRPQGQRLAEDLAVVGHGIDSD